jgi:hypothetical protein
VLLLLRARSRRPPTLPQRHPRLSSLATTAASPPASTISVTISVVLMLGIATDHVQRVSIVLELLKISLLELMHGGAVYKE